VNATFLQAAHVIGRRLAAAAQWRENSCTWIESAQQSFGHNVYDGSAGVGWFLARLAIAVGDAAILRTAIGAANWTLESLGSNGASAAAGLHGGAPGAAWAVADIGHTLARAELIERAATLMPSLLKAEAQPASEDVVGGQAGSLLALLGFDGRLPVAALAQTMGEELVKRAERPSLGLAWPARNAGGPMTGLAHGTSGVAWALLELHRITGLEEFRQAALAGFAFERAWFDRQTCLWRDPLSGNPTSVSWCRGAVGIALVRLRALQLFHDPQIQAEAGAALAALHSAFAGAFAPGGFTRAWEQINWSVCHGLMGLADTLLFASEVLGVGVHRRAAEEISSRGLWLSRKSGMWPCGTIDRKESFGLMLGLAGIGAVLLRMHQPACLPPVGLLIYSTSERGAERSRSSV
jgi:lantibiotic modifying enzyme